MTVPVVLATDTETRRWQQHHPAGQLDLDALQVLVARSRLGPFCVWPNPPSLDPSRNVLELIPMPKPARRKSPTDIHTYQEQETP